MPELETLEGFLKFAQAGGNVALVAFAYFVWKIERRLLQVETVLGFILKKMGFKWPSA